MADSIQTFFGSGDQLNAPQMSCRALLIFVITLLAVRISGRRSFGQHRPFDQVVAILLGAVGARAVVGASPFVATSVAMLTIVFLHRSLGWLSMRWRWIEDLANGWPREVFRCGAPPREQMQRGFAERRRSAGSLAHSRSRRTRPHLEDCHGTRWPDRGIA
jgi:hypothetical protein